MRLGWVCPAALDLATARAWLDAVWGFIISGPVIGGGAPATAVLALKSADWHSAMIDGAYIQMHCMLML